MIRFFRPLLLGIAISAASSSLACALDARKSDGKIGGMEHGRAFNGTHGGKAGGTLA